ncbi:isopentenyl-diphosphate delta-isomerase [Methanobrevibacter gottschalkii]|uniref:Isopentenyl-diphosphate delta-isomerase n=2 Tax=Methanobrevibacter gottschalkii TaxID=190974 RepID=A0A3N5B253_9EURY|nr:MULTISPECIES: type 2 isopentenyl-diphosphate Delta-isomerase [Methanobrevibacter]OEC97021.1 type 2 isopentenyl-diphosphate Delta-isomerase [Methanobrevibacter sp. A27]RPF51666.1 isopentenyl-diphosphate delta-isomerase [Methanobrevibacter gottschalkii DSM 11977]SEL28139.1 isopentenyl-diphosphate delta-isomerase [Methanobrevibacter gottschalkii]
MISDRKLEHLLICENYDVSFKNKTNGFEDIELIHNVLPEIDKQEIDLSTSTFGKKLDSPLFITAITGGHPAAKEINKQLAIAAENNNIALGVGSQRAACEHPELEDTYTVVRENAPNCLLVGNIGAPQLNLAEKAVEILDADILAIHLNPLQESIQPEGDLDARGYLDLISQITNSVNIPIIAKETGCGISAESAEALVEAGVDFIDIEGAGGTSWAAVETYRAEDRYLGEIFWDWGIPTAVSTVEVTNAIDVPVISSGGIRSGLEAAKAIALGADAVGMALPFLKNSTSQEQLNKFISRFNESLRIAMFLVGASNIDELKESKLVIRGKTREWLNERGINTKNYSRR